VHVQQLSHWGIFAVSGPRTLCLFNNWATCLKRLRTPAINVVGEGYKSYCTTIRGPDILPNVIVLGYVTFYQISTYFLDILFFHYWQNVFCGRMKWLGGPEAVHRP